MPEIMTKRPPILMQPESVMAAMKKPGSLSFKGPAEKV